MRAYAPLSYVTSGKPVAQFSELDEVRSIRVLTSHDGEAVPAGSVGTVMGVWADGLAYEVEFGDKPDLLLTVQAEDLIKAA